MENYEKDDLGNIVLPPVVSNGLSGHQWISVLEKEGYKFAGIGSSGIEGLSKALFKNKLFKATKGRTYSPVIVLSNNVDKDRYVPQIKKQYLQKGYRLAPMELLPLLCMQQSFKNFLRDRNYRFVELMHEPTYRSHHDEYCLALHYDGAECPTKIKGTVSTVSLCFFSDCMFIFIK